MILNIKDEKLLPTVVELNTLLAGYQIYYQNLRNFHWNQRRYKQNEYRKTNPQRVY